MKILTIVDTFGFLFRSYFALPPLHNSQGFPTGLLTGFTNLIWQLKNEYESDYLVFALDSKEENHRKSIDLNYKTQRTEAPEDLLLQLDVAIEWIQKMGFLNYSLSGFEADDIIASLSKIAILQAQKDGIKDFYVRIISHDKDLYQLITPHVFLLDPIKRKDIKEAECLEKYGVLPSQFVDYQSIVGDSADNVPGVKGIGAKGASALLQEFDSLDNLYTHIDKVSNARIKNLLLTHKEDALRSRQLVKLRDDLPLSFSLQECEMPKVNPLLKITEELIEYDMQRILTKLKKQGMHYRDIATQTEQSNLQRAKNATFSFDCECLDTLEKLLEVQKNITQDSIVSFDTETTSLFTREAKLVGFSFSLDGKRGYYVPVGHNYLGVKSQISLLDAKECILKLFSARELIGHNLKYDLEVLEHNLGVVPTAKIRDSMVLAWLVDSSSSLGLDFLMKYFFSYTMIPFSQVVGTLKNFSQVPIDLATQYASEDAVACYCLYFKLAEVLQDLQENSLLELANTLEFPFVYTLVSMETNGICINIDFFEELREESIKRLNALSSEIYKLCNREFNINSTQQVAQVLFEDLKLPCSKKTKVGYSTQESVLVGLSDTHPVIPKLLEYREVFKLKSTYIDPLLSYGKQNADHKIFASFLQTGTTTGRLSSKNPNLQNIPVKTEQGRLVRKGFIASKDCLLISLDYSQIELRLLAHFSEDAALIEAFFKDADIHLETAKKIFGEDLALSKRSIAKSINFGLIYGMGARKLSETLKITTKEAKAYIESYFANFPTVKQYLKTQEEKILQDGYVKTLLGHIRRFDFQKATEFQKAAYLREGVNTIFQGSAADIMKLAMNKIFTEIPKARMLIQVHDELIFEVLKEEAQSKADKIANIMENIVRLKVPLKCGVSIGQTWGDLK